MKITSIIKKLPFSVIILLIVSSILLISSKNMIMSHASYPSATSITTASAVV